MGKGEIACYKRFLLFPSAFKRLVSQGRQFVIVWQWVKAFADGKINVILYGIGRKHCGKKKKILVTSIFPQCFQKASFPGSSKVGMCGKGLTGSVTTVAETKVIIQDRRGRNNSAVQSE